MRRLLCVVIATGLWCASDAAAATLTLDAGREDVLLGERTRLAGTLAGVTDRARRTIVIEADPYPYDRWVVAERVRTDRRGRFAAMAEPPRNLRLRARLADDPAVVSPERTIHADFPGRIRRLGAAGPRPRLRFTVYAFRRAAIRRSPVFAYLSRSPAEPFRLVATGRWTTATRRYVATTLAYPRGTLTRTDRVLVCAKEPDPDAFGRPDERERRCGAAEIPRRLAAAPPATAPSTAPPPPAPPQPAPVSTITPGPTEPSRPTPGPWSFTMTGDEEDYIAGPRTWTHGPPEPISVTAAKGDIEFQITNAEGWWSGRFAAPPGQDLAVARYTDARRAAFRDGHPGLDVSGYGRGCNQLSGEFTVHELVWDGPNLRRFKVSFVQHCEHSAAAARGTFDFTAG